MAKKKNDVEEKSVSVEETVATPTVFRDLRMQDEDGTIDTVFRSDDGMKTMAIKNARSGLIITFYDKDNKATERFLPVGEIANLIAMLPG